MRILNICVFTSASEIGALILYFKKLILRIKKKTGKQQKFHVKAKNPSHPFLDNTLFSSTAPFLQKIFQPHPYCQLRGTKSPPL